MIASDALKKTHLEIASRLKKLSIKRGGGNVFLIEHGLDFEDVLIIKGDLRLALERDPSVSSLQWNWCYLPLLIVATEVGYIYRGTGTDFWPLIEKELQVAAGSAFRSGLVRLFEVAYREFATVKPGLSSWERHFPLIAWPIANALVPLEMQPQLARALQSAIRAGISGTDADALYKYILQMSSGQTSRRFENWLANNITATEVMRRLLYPAAEGWLSNEILERIDKDLRADVRASVAIEEARHATRRKSSQVLEIPSARYGVALSRGEPSHLLIRGPLLTGGLLEEAVSALGMSGERIWANGANRPLFLRAFLCGGVIEMRLPAVLPQNPLRCDEILVEPSAQSQKIMRALQPRAATYFMVGSCNTEAQAIFPGDRLPVGALVIRWVSPEGGRSPTFVRLLASLDKDADELRKAGFVLEARPVELPIMGVPLVGGGPKFAAGFPVFALQCESGCEPLLDGRTSRSATLRIRGRDWAMFTPEPGSHHLEEVGANGQPIAFEVVELPRAEPAQIAIDPPAPTLADLENGNLTIRVGSPITLEDVEIRLSLDGGGMPALTVTDLLPHVPCLLRGSAGVLSELREKFLDAPVGYGSCTLRIHIAGLRSKVIRLRPPLHSRTYDPASGWWHSDDPSVESVPSLVATCDAPVSYLYPAANQAINTGFRLVVARSNDQESLCSGLVLDDELPSIAGFTYQLPPLMRETESVGGQAGILDLVRAAVAWKLARSNNLLSDRKRAAVAEALEAAVTRQLCGEPWAKLEAGLNLDILTTHGALAHAAWHSGLARGNGLPEIRCPSDVARLNGYLIQRLQNEVPDIDEALSDWNDSTAGDLDLAVIDAYDDLRRYHEDIGLETFEEPDMSREASDWKDVLVQSRNMASLPMFDKLLLPASRWRRLSAAWYAELSQDDLIDLLDSCHVDCSRRSGYRWMGRSEIRNLLQFWLSPAQVLADENWAKSMAKALSDPQTARAIRYATLRWRLATRDLSRGGFA